MAQVICNGVIHDDANLPEGVDPKECVAADKWFADNAVKPAAADGVDPAPKPKKKAAAKKA